MTKQQLINAVHARTPFTKTQCDDAVEAILWHMKRALKAHKNIVIRRFGQFRILHKKARVGLNPRTGEHCPVSERSVVSFKAGQVLRRKVNEK